MKNSKVKTLIVEDIASFNGSLQDFDGSIDDIKVLPNIGKGDTASLLAALKGLTLYVIEAKKDLNLEEVGIFLPYHQVTPIIVTDTNLVDDPDNLVLNGDIKIPWESNDNLDIVRTHFLDEEIANNLCLGINAYTDARIDKLSQILAERRKLQKEIVKNNLT
jgi:hypothetical protein